MAAEPARPPGRPIRVLVVDDEPIAADAHVYYLERCPGFECAGKAESATAALGALNASAAAGQPIDLVLLDMNLPDLHGLDFGRRLRSAGYAVDIIAITAVREPDVIRGAIAAGMVQYLMKPFGFAAFAAKLENYRRYFSSLEAGGASASQQDVDRALASLRSPGGTVLPKGLSEQSLESVARLLRASPVPLSASEVGDRLSLSRVTARRYLEHLVANSQVRRSPRYGTPGRPENEYNWLA